MTEQKYFSPVVYTGNLNLKTKWFVYYYEPLVNGRLPKRIKVYEGINRIKTIDGRLKKAEDICERIRREKPVIYGLKPKLQQPESVLLDAALSMKSYWDAKTVLTYQGMANHFLKFISPKKDIQVTREDALAFVDHLFNKKLSTKTIKAYRNNIKTLYSKYIDRYEPVGFLNPFRKMPVIKTSSRSLMYFNDYQIQIIKEYCKKENPSLWLACQLQYYCFIRPNEIRQLKVEYFNLPAGFIEIPGGVSKNRKTQKVAIPSSLMPELQFLIHLDPDLYVFGGSASNLISRDSLSKAHRQVLKDLNIKGRYGFYSWKHTGVVKAWRAGINLKDIQMQLRHHSLDMVNEYLKNLGVMDSDRIRDLFPAI